MSGSIEQFKNTIYAAGLCPPIDIEPGRFIRFPGEGKKDSNRSAWCLMFEDQKGGCFGDWSTGLHANWFKTDRAQIKSCADVKASKQQQNLALEASRNIASKKAYRLWQIASITDCDHPYLKKKKISPHNIRIWHNQLVLPILDFKESIRSLQFIDAEGNKRLLKGGQKQNCFIPVSKYRLRSERLIICEGWATGCTLASQAAGSAVFAAIDAGNLEAVAMSARYYWPSSEIIIAGDDDRLTKGNPGATKAKGAAKASLAKPIDAKLAARIPHPSLRL